MDRLRIHVLDTFACQLAFASLPWSRDVWSYVQGRGGAGPAAVAFHGTKTTPEMAAFANAAFAHGFELDDVDMATTSHPGAVIVPSALAVGQQRASTGAAFLTAVVAGYETMIRVTRAGAGMPYRGFHSTPVTGPFGAAAAVGYLRGLGVEEMTHAFGICASRAGGVSEFATSGGTEKRLHCAYGAQMGMEAVGLASAGVTAPPEAIEGRRGLLAAVTDTPAPDEITFGLGQTYHGAGTGLKRHCCCGGQHSALDAIDDLVTARGIEADRIERIDVRLNPREYDAVALIRRPTDVISAQFSVAFGIGLRLVAGANGFRDYVDARLDDPRILSVADRVHCVRVDRGELLPGDGPSDVRVTLQDGEVLDALVTHPRGSARRPLGLDEAVAKFVELAGDVLGDRGASRVVEMVLGLAELPDVGVLADALVARPGFEPRDLSRLRVAGGR